MRRETQGKSEPNLITTSLRVERDLLAQFQGHAAKNYRTGSQELRRLMAEYVKAAEQGEAVGS